MKQKKIALLIDVDNVKFSNEAYEELYTKLSDIGDIVYGKLYGYNDRKHLTLSDSVAKYASTAASSLLSALSLDAAVALSIATPA